MERRQDWNCGNERKAACGVYPVTSSDRRKTSRAERRWARVPLQGSVGELELIATVATTAEKHFVS